MSEGLLAGLDVGAASVSALLMTPEGVEVARGRAPTHWAGTPTGGETSADSLVDSALEALDHALAQRPEDRILAIGVASMAESGVLTASHRRVLAPVIAARDTRDADLLGELDADLGGDTFSVRTGLPLRPRWTVTKHRWLAEHHPDVAEAKRWYNVGEWIVKALGGKPGSELSLTARTGWLDLRTATPYVEALAFSRARPRILGDPTVAGTPMGRASASSRLAALDGAVLTVAGHDLQVAVLGAGHREPGEVDSADTAGALIRTTAAELDDAAVLALTRAGSTVGWHVRRGRWAVLADPGPNPADLAARGEASARGAALLGGLAAGVYAAYDEMPTATAQFDDVPTPGSDAVAGH